MGKYLLAYHGTGMPEGESDQQDAMTEWMTWFGALGEQVADVGNPFGESSTLSLKGAVAGGSAGISGYSILTAESMAAAQEIAKGCPVVKYGGSVDIYEAVPVG